MKPDQIIKGRSYVNKSGRSERRVLDVGSHLKPRWLGDEFTEPKGEIGVRYVETRLGRTFYGPHSGKSPVEVYASTFAGWAHRIVPEGEEAPAS